MKQTYAAWRWGTSECRADAVIEAISHFFEPSSYGPDYSDIKRAMMATEDSCFGEEGVVYGLLGEMLEFEINITKPYGCSGELVDWIAGRHIAECSDYPALHMWAEKMEHARTPFFSGRMYKKASGL